MPRPARHDRQQALDRAVDLFWERGYHATSMKHIEQALDMRPGSLYATFGSKEGLWLACVDLLVETLSSRIDAFAAMAANVKTPLRERLQFAIGMTADYYVQNPDLRGFIARASLEPPPRSDIVSERLLKPLYDAARPLIRQGIDARLIPIDDPALVFLILHSALGQPDRVSSALTMLSPGHAEEDTGGRMADAIARLLLAGNGSADEDQG